MSPPPPASHARPSPTSSTACTTASPSARASASSTRPSGSGTCPTRSPRRLRAGRTEVVLLALPSWPLGPAVAEWVSAGVGGAGGARLHAARALRPRRRRARASRAPATACGPSALIAPGEELPPARVATLRENGTLGLLAISPEPLEHVVDARVPPGDRGRGRDLAPARARARADRRAAAVRAGVRRDRRGPARGRAGASPPSTAPRSCRCTRRARRRTRSPRRSAPALGERPTALYAFNDDYALAALEALRCRRASRGDRLRRQRAGAAGEADLDPARRPRAAGRSTSRGCTR